MKVGDVVRRLDDAAPPGTLYVVTSVSEEKTINAYIRSNQGARWRYVWPSNRKFAGSGGTFTGRYVTIIPAFIMFDNKPTAKRRPVTLIDCELETFDLMKLGEEFNRFSLFIVSEARRLSCDGDGGAP